MPHFRTEIVGLTERDQFMLRAVLAALETRIAATWSPHDKAARTLHFVDIDSPVGHRYWRGLDEHERRESSIVLAYKSPPQLETQAHWLGKPFRARTVQDLLFRVFDEPAAAEVIVELPPAPLSLLGRLNALRSAAR